MVRTITTQQVKTLSHSTLERQFKKSQNALAVTKIINVTQDQLNFYHLIRDEIIARDIYNVYLDNPFWNNKRTVSKQRSMITGDLKTIFN